MPAKRALSSYCKIDFYFPISAVIIQERLIEKVRLILARVRYIFVIIIGLNDISPFRYKGWAKMHISSSKHISPNILVAPDCKMSMINGHSVRCRKLSGFPRLLTKGFFGIKR